MQSKAIRDTALPIHKLSDLIVHSTDVKVHVQKLKCGEQHAEDEVSARDLCEEAQTLQDILHRSLHAHQASCACLHVRWAPQKCIPARMPSIMRVPTCIPSTMSMCACTNIKDQEHACTQTISRKDKVSSNTRVHTDLQRPLANCAKNIVSSPLVLKEAYTHDRSMHNYQAS